ncbi:MAG: XdhC family protein, partial [Hyphomicrobiaceae bacterium]
GGDWSRGGGGGGGVAPLVLVAGGAGPPSGAAQTLAFGVSDETAWRAGLPCGGRIEILVLRLDRETGVALLERLLDLERRRVASVAVTDISTGKMTIHAADGDRLSVSAGHAAARSRGLIETGDERLFVHVRTPPPRVVVVGATHIAQHLAGMLRGIGYATLIVDPRTAYASAERFPGLEVVHAWPDDAMSGGSLDRFTAVAAVSHNPDIDDGAIRLGLAADCFYVGALGSKLNHARRRERLAAAGVSRARLDRIRAPIGLDIGAVGAAEIAVSILAEIVAERRRAFAT